MRGLWLTIALAVPRPLYAQDCAYHMFSPEVVQNYVASQLLELGTTVGGLPVKTGVAESTSSFMLRDNAITGQFHYYNDTRRGIATWSVEDLHGAELIRMEEHISPCDGIDHMARCYETTLTTELDNVANREPPFVISEGPNGLRHYRYGEEMNVTEWRGEFSDTLRWAINAISAFPDELLLVPTTARDKVLLAYVQDPLTRPLLPFVSIKYVNNTLILAGTVPSNGVYGAFVSDALDLGIYRIDTFGLIIDTRLRSYDWELGYCL